MTRQVYGKLGGVVTAAGVLVPVYTVPDHIKYVEVDINILNTSVDAAKVDLYISKAAVPGPVDAVENQLSLAAAGGVLKREDERIGTGETIYIQADKAGVVIRVSGYEGVLA